MLETPPPFDSSDSALRYLDSLGRMADADIDLAEGALALCAVNHPQLSLSKYRSHFDRMVSDITDRHVDLLNEGAPDNVDTRIAALSDVFVRQHGYLGDDFRYDDLQNADLVRVVDRRLGLPITLSIICIHLARELGWDVEGINFPGHFVIRLSQAGQLRIIDPFQGCIVLSAHDLREILKKTVGPNAELSASYYEPANNREILIRLQNNIKLRQIEGEDYQGAYATVELMRRIAPDEYRLDLDAGVLLARLERPKAAVAALERYAAAVPSQRDRLDALSLIASLRGNLN